MACGDALGAPVEAMPRGYFLWVKEMTGGGYHDLKPGEWTDDTSMALCLGQSLLEKGAFDARDQLGKYLRWLEEGYMSSQDSAFGVGYTVRDAVMKFKATGDEYCGSEDPMKAGNGSIMRLAPVPMFYAHDFQLAVTMSAQSSRTTHSTAEAVDACRYLGALIHGALNGESKDDLLSPRYSPVDGYWLAHPLARGIDEIAAGAYKAKEPPQIKGTAYVVKSLEAALWCFYKTTSFTEGTLMAVNLGDDADTTAAVYGQIAGAHYGVEQIPDSWLEKLSKRELIENMAEDIFLQAEKMER